MAFIEYYSNGPFIHSLIPHLLQKIHIHLSSFLQHYHSSLLQKANSPTIVVLIGLFPPLFAFPSLLAVRRKDGGGGKAKLVAGRQEDLPPSSFLFSLVPYFT